MASVGTAVADGSGLDHGASALEIISEADSLQFAQKRFNVQWVSQTNLKLKNVVWLPEEEIRGLLDDHDSTELPLYVQIADQVHRVAQGHMENGWIGIGDHNLDELDSACFQVKGNRAISVGLCNMQTIDKTPAKKVCIDLSLVKRTEESNQSIIVTFNELQEKIRQVLKGEILSTERTFQVQFPWGVVNAKIDSLESTLSDSGLGSEFSVINDKTEFKFYEMRTSDLSLVDRVYEDEVERFAFSIYMKKRVSWAVSDILPLTISESDLRRMILEKLSGKKMEAGTNVRFPHRSGWTLQVSLKKPILRQEFVDEFDDDFVTEEYVYGKAYVMNQESEIELIPKGNVIITESKPEPVAKAHFHIVDIPGEQPRKGVDHDKELWFDLYEFQSYMRTIDKPFVLDQKFMVDLLSGRFYVTLMSLDPRSPGYLRVESNRQKVWELDDETEIEVTAESALKVNLVRDDRALDLKRVMFEVIPERLPSNELTLTLDDLSKLIFDLGPDTFVDSQQFALTTPNGDRLKFKIAERQFSPDLVLEKGVTVFGTITDETEMDFFVKPEHKITIVDNVFRDEIEKVVLAVKSSKRVGVGKWGPIPLVVDVDKFNRELREVISKESFLFDSFDHVIPFQNGWDITVKFGQVILDREARLSARPLKLIDDVQRKTAYQITDKTVVEYRTLGKDVVLAQGDPVPANVLNFRVIKIQEDYTSSDRSIVKGNWINIEEFHRALQAMERDFFVRERLQVVLESGVYIIEVKSGRPLDQSALADRKLYQKVEASIVRTGEFYPLKKITLEVFPEDQASDHISLKDEELRQLFLDDGPDRFVLNQLFTFDTPGNHSVRMKIKQLNIEKREWTTGKNGFFGTITDETEFVFDGRKNSKIAIQATPKILEMADPVKYLEELGIGGIEDQFEKIYRIFFSRSERLGAEARRRGTNPVRGMLLYGPPGTGKTTLARHIGDMFGCTGDRLQMITATEVFNKWFGNSEKYVRKLFEPASQAVDEYGDESPLYVVVIDEIDALLPKREGGPGGKVRDSIVNQFLGAMDGLKQLHNLLVIGITNRMDQIDPAALRHGRLGTHIEIDLPDSKGRQKIFEIHTRKLSEEGILHENVSCEELSGLTDKYSGADIQGVVEEASLISLERLNKHRDLPTEELAQHPDGKVTMDDFTTIIEQRKDSKEDMGEEVRRSLYT